MNKSMNLAMAGALALAASVSTDADAQCEQSRWTNYCGESNVRLTANSARLNDYWDTDLHDTGRETAFARLECHNAGASRILHRGSISRGQRWSCGTGALFNYPLIFRSVCGLDASCDD